MTKHRDAGKSIAIIEGVHFGRIFSAQFSADGVVLVTGGEDGVVNVIECGKLHGQRVFKQKAKLTGHEDAVLSVAISKVC